MLPAKYKNIHTRVNLSLVMNFHSYTRVNLSLVMNVHSYTRVNLSLVMNIAFVGCLVLILRLSVCV